MTADHDAIRAEDRDLDAVSEAVGNVLVNLDVLDDLNDVDDAVRRIIQALVNHGYLGPDVVLPEEHAALTADRDALAAEVARQAECLRHREDYLLRQADGQRSAALSWQEDALAARARVADLEAEVAEARKVIEQLAFPRCQSRFDTGGDIIQCRVEPPHSGLCHMGGTGGGDQFAWTDEGAIPAQASNDKAA